MKVTYGAIVQRASGRFGGTVHSNWKGIDVVRRFAKPSNPNTANQQDVRMAFKNLTKSFQMFSSYPVTIWSAYATGKKFIARNAYIGQNVGTIAGNNSLSGLVISPGASGAVPPSAVSGVDGGSSITGTMVIPAPPPGWTVTAAVLLACSDVDPSVDNSMSDLQWFQGADVAAPFTAPVITPLTGGNYRVFGIAKYQTPDGLDAYSASVDGGTVFVA